MPMPSPAADPRARAQTRALGSIDLARALKQAALAGIIAFGIFLPLIGFRTIQTMSNELALETRPGLLATLVLLVICGSLFISLVIQPWSEKRAAAAPVGASLRAAALRAAFAKYFTPFALGFVTVSDRRSMSGRCMSSSPSQDSKWPLA